MLSHFMCHDSDSLSLLMQLSSVQKLTCLEDQACFMADWDRLFHWGVPKQLPKAKSSSPQDMMLRKFMHPCTVFASEQLRRLAVMTLELSQLADIAVACMSEGQPATGYWWETLSLKFLQVKPHLCLPHVICSQCRLLIGFFIS